jgi:transposase
LWEETRAKVKGVYKGRPAIIDPAQIAALKAEGLGVGAIAKRLNISRASVYLICKMGKPDTVRLAQVAGERKMTIAKQK